MNNFQEPNFSEIPQFLQDHNFWCVWPAEPKKNGGFNKRPLGIDNMYLATNKTNRWSSFENVKEFYNTNKGIVLNGKKGPIAGVGILLHESTDIIGIDFDHVVDTDGKFAEWAEHFINALAKITYCELSPSGKGIHAYLYGIKPSGECKGGPGNNLEIYSKARFITVTGNKINDCPEIAASGDAAQAMIDTLMAFILNKNPMDKMPTELDVIHERGQMRNTPESIYDKKSQLTDEQIIEKARKHTKGFIDLFDTGNISRHGNDHSAADLALCDYLAFWVAGDAAQMDRIMRQSALLKDPERLAKWDRKTGDSTYGAMTMQKAISECSKVYDPNYKKTAKLVALPDTGKQKIVYRDGELERLIREFDSAIKKHAYRLNDLVVGIARLPEAKSYSGLTQEKDTGVIFPFDPNSLAVIADKCATWVKIKKINDMQYEEYPINPPAYLMKIYLAAQNEWRLPILTGLINCPIIKPDGSILDKPGYDSKTGLYADFKSGDFPLVGSNPDKNSAIDALDFLKYCIEEFPFKTDIDKSVAIAAILTTVLRPSVKSAPLFAFSAPCPGTGKSAFADLIGVITTGKPCAAMNFTQDEAEFEKAIVATLLQGSPVTLIDNVIGELNSPILNIVLTQETFTGRILGISKMAKLPTNSIWLATGNNLTIIGDMTRRTLLCTLDAGVEKPADRVFKRNIDKWGIEDRGNMIQCALTILKAYHLAGKPRPDGFKPLNGFNDWSDWIRGALLWLGQADPKDSQLEIETHDPERENLRNVLQAWRAHFESDSVTTKDLLNRNPPDGAMEIPATQLELYRVLLDAIPHRGELNGRLLGKWLAKHSGRVIDGLKLVDTGEKRQGMAYWRVTKS